MSSYYQNTKTRAWKCFGIPVHEVLCSKPQYTSLIIVMWNHKPISVVTQAEALVDAADDQYIIGRSIECASYDVQLSKSLHFYSQNIHVWNFAYKFTLLPLV